MNTTEKIKNGCTRLGIELGSTRIKAVLTDDSFTPIASGSFDWENRFEDGCWTYSLDDIHNGIRGCYASLAADVKSRFGTDLEHIGAMGISAMMHGYMAFDRSGQLLVPFRTWRNTMTAKAAEELTALLGFNIPQRWSCAHLYQAVLNGEEHIKNIHHINTLAGYIHELLTGVRAVGTGEASGIFPVSGESYDKDMLEKYSAALASRGFTANISEVFPKAVKAGTPCGALTAEGAKFLDPTGKLKPGVPFCPPEGDAGTGMTASNAVRPQTGNISAGTSIFAMLVLDKPLKGVYPEIDVVTTPDGAPVAMVHCNNCCSEIDVWVKMFGEFAELTGHPMDKSALYETLYKNAMNGSPDCGGVTAYNYLSGEPVTGVESGRPMYFRAPDSKMSLANFFRAQLYSTMAALKHGMDILFNNESAEAAQFTGHGGLFKVKGAAQQLMADALKAPVAVMTTAGEGGAWGMSLLASYMLDGGGRSLADWLDKMVFADMERYVLTPDKNGSEGFDKFMERYAGGLAAERILGKD